MSVGDEKTVGIDVCVLTAMMVGALSRFWFGMQDDIEIDRSKKTKAFI